MSNELAAAALYEVEVLIEYVLPLTSKRIYVLLIGTHPRTGAISAVVWENKQWTLGDIESVEDRIVRVLGRDHLHPQEKVQRYVQYLSDFNPLCQKGDLVVTGLAFLHNATAIELAGLRTAAYADLAQ